QHRLPGNGPCEAFLDNWQTARASAKVAAEGIWKDLQNAKAAAGLELEQLLAEWREEARSRVQDALSRLPAELAASNLPAAEIQESLVAPLQTFLASLDNETEVTRVSTLPERADRLLRGLGEAIHQEREKRTAKPSATDGGQAGTSRPKAI